MHFSSNYLFPLFYHTLCQKKRILGGQDSFFGYSMLYRFLIFISACLENSLFQNKLLSSTIHPHEIESAGSAEIMIPLTGEISENTVGSKNMINTTVIMTINVIFSFMVFGGVRKIFLNPSQVFLVLFSF